MYFSWVKKAIAQYWSRFPADFPAEIEVSRFRAAQDSLPRGHPVSAHSKRGSPWVLGVVFGGASTTDKKEGNLGSNGAPVRNR